MAKSQIEPTGKVEEKKQEVEEDCSCVACSRVRIWSNCEVLAFTIFLRLALVLHE
jgi:hypothetical protein